PAPIKRILITSKPASSDDEVGPGDVRVLVSNRVQAASVVPTQLSAATTGQTNSEREAASENKIIVAGNQQPSESDAKFPGPAVKVQPTVSSEPLAGNPSAPKSFSALLPKP